MIRKLLFTASLTLALIVAHAPAGLVDSLLDHFSEGSLRLQQPEGSLWHGRGVLASRDANGRSLSPWLPLGWDFDRAALAGGAIGWNFTSNGNALGALQVSPGQVRLSGWMMYAPANAALASIPHPAAQAGWQGDLVFEASRWQCALNWICDGEARLLWQGVRSALFPGRSFGDYEIKIAASAGDLRFQVATQSGAIQISGNGEATVGSILRFDGIIAGDPDFLVRLPSIAGGAAQPTGKPGQFSLHWPPR